MLRRSALIATTMLWLVACGGSSDSAARTAPGSTAGAPTSRASAAPATLQFSAPLVGGGELDAATLAGAPVLFWFWAPT